MTRLLVTGGAGFIGSAIVRRALAEGYEVRVLDSLRADVHGDDGGAFAGAASGSGSAGAASRSVPASAAS
ncbi:MAG: NAD-dependent epimerase/dehydratase family protein, partial [Curtobacterium sp.]